MESISSVKHNQNGDGDRRTLANYDGVECLTQFQTKSDSTVGPNKLDNHGLVGGNLPWRCLRGLTSQLQNCVRGVVLKVIHPISFKGVGLDIGSTLIASTRRPRALAAYIDGRRQK